MFFLGCTVLVVEDCLEKVLNFRVRSFELLPLALSELLYNQGRCFAQVSSDLLRLLEQLFRNDVWF